ncbi:hypothetical protein HanIR_Chr01g0043531 [Helianthus annuus]|nr:hypothetical protein HanIR_Chr01g0043531 [Helianthus annuus]
MKCERITFDLQKAYIIWLLKPRWTNQIKGWKLEVNVVGLPRFSIFLSKRFF